jgi:hypothetical protein
MTNLFYYTEVKTETNDGQESTKVETGYSFSLDDVILTYPDFSEGEVLNIVLAMGADKINPVDYQYRRDPKTGQKIPVKVSKFEITNEPVVVQLKVKEEINRFFSLSGGPTW